MYLAPLNFDRFFKKVFSDSAIAKGFLEDFLDIRITDIQRLKEGHRVTDDAAVVEFDYRCRINDGRHFIIDMQQWYKTDVIERFYVYHALNTALQLEHLPLKNLWRTTTELKESNATTASEGPTIPADPNTPKTGTGDKPETDREDTENFVIEKDRKIKKTARDYKQIDPVFTIIWMVDDCLGFEDDYVSSAMSPKVVVDFVQNKELWIDPDLLEIIAEREKILKTLNNKSKGFDFLSKNELVFAFQPNIVKNASLSGSKKKYTKWFEFAKKTRDKENKASDFDKFRGSYVFDEMIRRLIVQNLPQEDVDYIATEDENEIRFKRFEDGIREEGRVEGRDEGRKEGRKEGERKKEREMVVMMHQKGADLNYISELTGKSCDEIKEIINFGSKQKS